MGTNCACRIVDLFLFRYEKDISIDDLSNIENPYFEGRVNQIYPHELQLSKANVSDTEAPFLIFTSFYF